tara:strand:- start:595 stop:705 length:111 start_codon:yes stop_codon:yes gene_type:complete
MDICKNCSKTNNLIRIEDKEGFVAMKCLNCGKIERR